MISYIEKGWGLHLRVQAAGHVLFAVDGVWQSDDDKAVQAIIDSYDLAAEQTAFLDWLEENNLSPSVAKLVIEAGDDVNLKALLAAFEMGAPSEADT